jgi:hypothetical protein
MKTYITTISQDLAGTSSFRKSIYCPFVPKSVIIKNSMYENDGTEAGVSGIRSNLVSGNEVICYIDDGVYTHSNIEFPLKKPVNGQFDFECVDTTGALENRDGDLFITLEIRG